MSDPIETITVTGQFLTVPRLIWNRFKKPMPGHASKVFAVNPGLAGMGPFLPVGTVVRMPIPVEQPTQQTDFVRLWSD